MSRKNPLILLPVVWTAIVVLMAMVDVLAPTREFKMSFWLILFFISLVSSLWILILYPIRTREQEIKVASLLSLFLVGLFFGVYNVTWQISTTLKTYFLHGYIPSFYLKSVNLYPFAMTFNTFEWYTSIFLGFFALALSANYLKKNTFYANVLRHK